MRGRWSVAGAEAPLSGYTHLPTMLLMLISCVLRSILADWFSFYYETALRGALGTVVRN